jgi:hypothetical protein
VRRRHDAQGLLEVREAELVREARDLVDERVGELDRLVRRELLLPVADVLRALAAGRVAEHVLLVEPAGCQRGMCQDGEGANREGRELRALSILSK